MIITKHTFCSFVGRNSFQVTKQTQKRIVEYFCFVAQNDRLLGIRFYIRNVQLVPTLNITKYRVKKASFEVDLNTHLVQT